MITDAYIEKALDFIRDNAPALAQAKANRVHLEEFRKTKKAILFREAPEGTIQAREAYAYSHAEYIELIDGLKAAVEEEERLRWLMKAAEFKIDVWRTQQANNRSLDRGAA